jgi:paraquat-inducible protein A
VTTIRENKFNHNHTMGFRNKLAFLISIISFCFLFPGVNLPMLTIQSKGHIAAQLPHVEYNFFGIPSQEGTETHKMGIKVFDNNRSILGVVYDLWSKGYHFVCIMIFTFSVAVPVLKELLLFYIFFSKNPKTRESIFSFIKSIGKWSMCDVFIVAIFLTYLGTGAMGSHSVSNINIMDFNVHLNIIVISKASLQIGAWCFLTYCLLSLTALQLYKKY